MIFFSYNFLQILFFPIFFLLALFRIVLNKENLKSIKQKVLCNYNFTKLRELDHLIHFSSIGELNSINYLIENLSTKKIILSCSTLSSYNLAKKKYQNFLIIFLPLDFSWNINKFLSRTNIKKIIWIDSEIWPNWLIISKRKKIKNILINGRLSEKSYSRWSNFSSFAQLLGSQYSLIFAKSFDDKIKFENIFKKNVFHFGNLKFYQKLNLINNKKNIICFASIHKEEFEKVLEIIQYLNFSSIEKIIIIPRHVHFSSKLQSMIKQNYVNKIFILDKFGENDLAYESAKLTFMGGSLFEHGGQNPLEPLSKGCFVLSGQYINNFKEIYSELENLSLAKVLNDNNAQEISSMMNKYIDMGINNHQDIQDYFNLNTKQLRLIIDKVEEC
jgi:3-deoxy-D-manno-octulosonic-acid transferase